MEVDKRDGLKHLVETGMCLPCLSKFKFTLFVFVLQTATRPTKMLYKTTRLKYSKTCITMHKTQIRAAKWNLKTRSEKKSDSEEYQKYEIVKQE